MVARQHLPKVVHFARQSRRIRFACVINEEIVAVCGHEVGQDAVHVAGRADEPMRLRSNEQPEHPVEDEQAGKDESEGLEAA